MKAKRKTLQNGVRVVLVPMEDNPTVTVMVLVSVGAEHEKPDQYGIAHFLEHMCFKGTNNRLSSSVIARELEGLGAQTNAFTSRRYTGYYAKAASKDVHKIFDVVADLYLNSAFPTAELEKEKGVVVEEINMYDDMPQAKVEILFEELMYGNSAEGHSILGSKESVRSLTQEDLFAFHKEHYHAGNTVIAVAGSFDEARVMADVKKMFGLVKSKKPLKAHTPVLLPERVLVHTTKSEQTHLVLGVPAVSKKDKDAPIQAVLANILGGGMSSRLFHKLREEMGVCYYVYASANAFEHYGNFTIHAGIPAGKLEEVVRVIKEELNRVVREEVSEEELRITRNYMIGSLVNGLETSNAFANYYGQQELVGMPLQTPAQKIKTVKAITGEQVRRVAKKLFGKNEMRLSVVGPVKGAEKLEALLLD